MNLIMLGKPIKFDTEMHHPKILLQARRNNCDIVFGIPDSSLKNIRPDSSYKLG